MRDAVGTSYGVSSSSGCIAGIMGAIIAAAACCVHVFGKWAVGWARSSERAVFQRSRGAPLIVARRTRVIGQKASGSVLHSGEDFSRMDGLSGYGVAVVSSTQWPSQSSVHLFHPSSNSVTKLAREAKK